MRQYIPHVRAIRFAHVIIAALVAWSVGASSGASPTNGVLARAVTGPDPTYAGPSVHVTGARRLAAAPGTYLPLTLHAAGPPWDDVKVADPLDRFFGLERIHTIRIDVDEHGLASLLTRPKTYVHAGVTIDGEPFADVGVRLKGGAGSFVPLDGDYPPISGDGNGRPGKSAFIIDFNRYVKGVDYHGLEKLTLNNLVQDPSGIHEYLGYAVFRESGVPASRAGFATVHFNGEEKGLYATLETPDNEAFLKHWFGSDKGNLYEGEYGTDLRADKIDAFDQDNGRDESRRDLRQLVAVLDDIEAGTAPFADLEAHIDVDRYLAYATAELFLGHWDGYAWSTNNYMIHHQTQTPGGDGGGIEGGKWVFLPWGIDQLFEDPLGEFGGVMRSPGPEWGPGHGGRIHQLCFEDARCLLRLAEAQSRLLTRVQSMDLVGLAGDARALVQAPLLAEANEFGDPDLTVQALEQVTHYIDEHARTIDRWLPCLSGTIVDGDRDGHDGCTTDCNDHDPRIHPGAEETCNYRDDDCNGRIDDPDDCPKCLEVDVRPGEAFSLCFERETWSAARQLCVDRGGDLASFHDEPTFEHVTFAFMERVGVHSSWIGLNDREQEGTFTWTDATPLDFERWAPYAPHRHGEDTNCVLSHEFGWLDAECDEPHAYVCRSP